MEEKNLYGGGLPADARAAAYRQCDRAAQTGSETGGARTHVRRARRREPLQPSLATTALATYVRKVCARATRKHTDGFFDFHSDFFSVP